MFYLTLVGWANFPSTISTPLTVATAAVNCYCLLLLLLLLPLVLLVLIPLLLLLLIKWFHNFPVYCFQNTNCFNISGGFRDVFLITYICWCIFEHRVPFIMPAVARVVPGVVRSVIIKQVRRWLLLTVLIPNNVPDWLHI